MNIRACASPDHQRISTSSIPAEKPKVLVVDDEPQVLVALTDLLSDEFVVQTTSSPERALEMARTEGGISVVISDQRMPEMSGDELLGQLSRSSRAERILVTGYADLTAVIKAVNDGRIFAYITKPWNANDLQLKVHQAAEHFRLATALAYERQLLNDLMENVPDGIYFKDPELRFLRANAPIARMLNQADGAELSGKRLGELSVEPVEAEKTEAEERQIIREGIQVVDLIRDYGNGTARRWFSETKAPVRDSSGEVIGLVGISRNVTDRIEAEHARQRQQQRIARLTRIHSMTSAINAAIVRIQQSEALLEMACRIAVREGELAFASVVVFEEASDSFRVVASVFSDGSRATPLAEPGQTITEGAAFFHRVNTTRSAVIVNDTEKDADLSSTRQFSECGHCAVAAFPLIGSGRLEYVFALSSTQAGFFDSDEVRLLTDVAENLSFALGHFATKAQLDFLAYYDELTQLPNQRLLMELLTQQLATSKSVERQLAVLMLDIDRFSQINETLGRSGGDILLKQLSTRLKSGIGEQDSLARVEGNRFAILVPLVENEAEVASMVEDVLLPLLNESFEIGTTEVLISARFGISLFPSDGSDRDTLISNAEAALKKAKSQGQRYVFYAPTMNNRVAEQLALETKLRRALENEEFVLHYQPKVALNHGGIVGLEALIRWQSPENGLVPPGVFIPVLEETGLIVDVGRWVLMRAAAQYTEWALAGKKPPRIAVNVSAIQLSQANFLDSIEEMQSTYEVAAPNLDLEITESVFVDDLEGNVQKLTVAQDKGLQVAIDDFGTGYSSLAYLSRLPIDVLKIDRSFITRMTRDPQDMALVTTVISLAHSLDCKVIAEGVERPEQAQLLRLLRCDQIQGYLIGRPAPAAEVCERFAITQEFTWARSG